MYRMALSIRLPDDVEARLERLAKKTGRSKSFYVREAIEAHLQDLEDVYLAEKTLAAVREGRESTTSLDELLQADDLAR